MMRLIVTRLLQAIPLFVVISVLVFWVAHLAPGDPISNALQGQISQQSIDDIRASYGLDRSLAVQYADWLGHLLHGDWGTSLALKVPVFDVLAPAFANTLLLAAAAVLICVLFGVLVGLYGGLHRDSAGDRLALLLIQLGHNLPVAWLGLALIWLFAIQLRWLPVSGMYDLRGGGGLIDLLRHLVLPAFAAAIISMLILARLVRATVIDIMNADYIRTCRSQGFSHGRILRRHVGRNLLAPVVNMTGLQVGYLLSGVIFVEKVFAWPGIGSQLYNAAAGQDYPVIQTGVLLVTACFLVINLLTDITLDALDPRARAA
ncbi:ABC transporter permease [Pseudomonas typographi]|uniref:ABC transporter permease n=1 Tax=Pseudomonas typographi TaxID=2715964 RepID=A0ABR7YWT6_9PSED|nr:ABC transporter permease [Pseudomonas typographi]MBD1552615.1 ABC transporter permease [Pseudomonas typographi]MBD1586196.1 ABC transporter permease [Pseudomonas typographi]MBD1597667.1 ABC transporter permease [Pseudomonas typographi]